MDAALRRHDKPSLRLKARDSTIPKRHYQASAAKLISTCPTRLGGAGSAYFTGAVGLVLTIIP